MTKKIKLPKQWLHWAKLMGLKPVAYGRIYGRGVQKAGFYLLGKDRQWRVNCHGIFECSCPLEHFDRWANSRGAEYGKIPQTQLEFFWAVKKIHYDSKDAK